jgi:hypothetical protein
MAKMRENQGDLLEWRRGARIERGCQNQSALRESDGIARLRYMFWNRSDVPESDTDLPESDRFARIQQIDWNQTDQLESTRCGLIKQICLNQRALVEWQRWARF